jgi:hypothetical protein
MQSAHGDDHYDTAETWTRTMSPALGADENIVTWTELSVETGTEWNVTTATEWNATTNVTTVRARNRTTAM